MSKLMEENIQMCLWNLPEAILIEILLFCDIKTLGNLAVVSKQFYRLTNDDKLWQFRYQKLTLSGVNNKAKTERFHPDRMVSFKEEYRIGRQWIKAIYREHRLIRYSQRLMPCLQIDNEFMYTSNQNIINCYRSSTDGRLNQILPRTYSGLQTEVSNLKAKERILVGTSVTGEICGWDQNSCEKLFCVQSAEPKELLKAVDFHGDCLVTGGKDTAIRIWKMDSPNLNLIKTCAAHDRVWTVAINPIGDNFASGTAGFFGIPPLNIWDLNLGIVKAVLDQNTRHGAGVLDVMFESPNILLSCGYDTNINLWDLRTEECVKTWTEPYDETIYCIKTRGSYGIISGTARHGMTRLWDKRKNVPIQHYYPKRARSPVYSLDMTNDYLYLALDQGIHMFDFSISNGPKKSLLSLPWS